MKKLKGLWCDNRGLTFIELLMIIAIMGVIFSVASLSLGLRPSTEAKKTVLSINSMITRTKVGTLAKTGDVYMAVKVLDSGKIMLYYYEDDKMVDSEMLTEHEVSVYFTTKKGDPETLRQTDAVQLGNGESLVLAFNRRTSGFLSLMKSYNKSASTDFDDSDTALDSSNQYKPPSAMPSSWLDASDTSDDFCTYIWVSGGSVEYTITLGPVTGSHYADVQ